MKRIVFTVTNDLNYDQRMIRICNTLSEADYSVLLVGVAFKNSPPLISQQYDQYRIYCFFQKGFSFYAEYNIKLFIKLLFIKCDAVCCIDLDTIMPVYFASKLRMRKFIYDAHEYFSELKEVITRRFVRFFWKSVEKFFVPQFKFGYTVSYKIAYAFKNKYGLDYEVIMNASYLKELTPTHQTNNKLIYQGAINEGRGLEFLIPAMIDVESNLDIYGDGNFMEQLKFLIKQYNVEDKVHLKGKLAPAELNKITGEYLIGINLVENKGLNQYYSLANKFFDYIHAEVPQITMNFPEYSRINNQIEVAICIDDLAPETIATAINTLLRDKNKQSVLKANCKEAKQIYCWQNEANKLISFYKKVLG